VDERRLLESIAGAQRRFFAEKSPARAFDGLLADLLEITESEYGFLGQVLASASGAPFLRMSSITDIAWNDETRRMLAESGPDGLEFHNLATLFGHALSSGRPVISNDPARDPRRGGLPAGHPPLRAFLGIPLFAGAELVGMAGVANRAGGYDDALVAALEPFTTTCASLVAAQREAREREAAERDLRRRVELDRLLARIARDFVEASPESTDAAIEQALALAADFLGAQRAIGAIRIDGEDRVAVRYVVGEPLAAAAPTVLGFSDFPGLGEQLLAHGLVMSDDAARALARSLVAPAFREVRAFAALIGGQIPKNVCIVFQWLAPGASLDGDDVAAMRLLPDLISAALGRKRALAMLRESESQFRALAELLPQAVVVTDPQRNVLFANRAARAFLGRSIDLGRPLRELTHPDDRERLAQTARDALAARRGAPVEVRMQNAAGAYRSYLIDYVPAFGAVGGISGDLWTAFDVTEQRALEARLRESEKLEAVGRLAGGIAHDFNNILTAISGHAELARLGEPLGRSVAGDLAGIREATERAAELTRELLAFARRQPVQPRVVDLNALVARARALLERLIGEYIQLEIREHTRALPIEVDPGQLEQVIVNLALHARDAMPGGGTLTIETRERESAGARCAELTVADTGAGMDASTLARVFEPFFTTKELGRGSGLGLSTCYGIVRQAGGEIEVASPPSAGAIFTVRVPIAAAPLAPDTHGASSAREPGGTEAVLLVEDERAVREVVERALRELGYRVTSASDGASALRAVASWQGAPLDLLITDVVMPDASGGEVAARVRAAFADARVLYMSGYSDSFDAAGLGSQPGCTFLAKPFTPGELATAIRKLLDTRPPSLGRSL
jgi:PAS domain S-box-containing protein